MERYYPLIDYKEELTAILNKAGAVRKEQVTEAVTEDSASVRDYIQRERRPEIVLQPKEVNCHREAVKIILHTSGGESNCILKAKG